MNFFVGEHKKANRLVVRGKKENVRKTHIQILRFLGQVLKEERQRIEDEALSKEVQWKYEDEYGQFQAYDVTINARIESAYKQGQGMVMLELEEGKVCFDFIKEEETSAGRRCKIHRSELLKGKRVQICHQSFKCVIILVFAISFIIFSFIQYT